MSYDTCQLPLPVRVFCPGFPLEHATCCFQAFRASIFLTERSVVVTEVGGDLLLRFLCCLYSLCMPAHATRRPCYASSGSPGVQRSKASTHQVSLSDTNSWQTCVVGTTRSDCLRTVVGSAAVALSGSLALFPLQWRTLYRDETSSRHTSCIARPASSRVRAGHGYKYCTCHETSCFHALESIGQKLSKHQQIVDCRHRTVTRSKMADPSVDFGSLSQHGYGFYITDEKF